MALMIMLLTQGPSFAQTGELGRVVTNRAEMTYNDITVITPPAILVIEAERTASTIEFFRYAPGAPSAVNTAINGSDYSPSGAVAGPFAPIGAALNGGGTVVDTSGLVPVTPADYYATGELMLVRVNDPGQNGYPNVIETVTIIITTSTGDQITLRLYESGPDTGEFWAYIPSSRDPTPRDDNTLTTGSETVITATYTDSFDATEVSVDTALVDPYCRVFNALTGDLVDNALVTIIDVATGQPAIVYGVDGISVYPATVTTGTQVTDASGYIYDLREGEFRFPILPAGTYRIEVVTPEGYSYSSVFTPAEIAAATNNGFELDNTGSFGQDFTSTQPGPVHFDLPIDPKTDIVLTKAASPSIGDVGDFIRYTVSVQNRGAVPAPMQLHDVAPRGFRYLRGSARLGALPIAEPTVARNGRELTFNLPRLEPGASHDVHYIMQIGADARPGEHINSAVILDGFGGEDSNIARAVVTLREDLFRTTSTIIGRVAEYACDGDEEWDREILDGTGVAGVRLYTETGAYSVTDEDGLYHFEGMKRGTHVVQIDEETLPKGYSAMTCEDNSQYANRKTSKFIDTHGGGIWRANFYLQRTGDTDTGPVEKAFNDLTEYKDFDTDWLNGQDASAAWVYPQDGKTPSSPSVNIGIKHGPEQTVSLQLNGHAVPLLNFLSRDSNDSRSVMMSRWRGVDIHNGKNVFIASLKDSSGNVVQTLRRELFFIREIARATPVEDQSILVADGRTTPIIAVRIEDAAGRPVHAGRKLLVDVAAPYRLETGDLLMQTNELVAPSSTRHDASVGPDGIARIALEPTLKTGSVTIVVTLDDGRKVDVSMYLKPEKRDWIIVGLAEGSTGLESARGNDVELTDGGDSLMDGRVAFFAKGLIKGDWLMTIAVDTDKRRGTRDGDLFEQIDPNAYYTLYGDRTYQDHEAESRYPLYLKLEKDTFYAMFGDYNTNMTESKLMRYSRRLSGFKTEYAGERFDVIGFAAETNQGFAKDEIPANGTSGTYHTTYNQILANSEVIEIETRDRFRNDIVLERRLMTRHLDYTIDYYTGDIIFRLPVDGTDAKFNPNVIVVDYETSRDAERNMTYGGRAAVKLADGKVTVAASYIHEEGRADSPGGKQDMAGLDIVADITPNTQIRAEYAVSSDKSETGTVNAKAYMAEVLHTSDDLAATAYVREEEAGFGVGQQGSNTAGIRRIGADAAYTLLEKTDDLTGARTLRTVKGQSYHEENISNGATRLLSEVSLTQEGEKFGGSIGLRQVKENTPSGERESLLALASVRATSARHGFTASLAHEQPIGGKDESSSFPQRTTIGFDKTITTKAAVSLRHELLEGTNAHGENTVVGVTYSPWTGTDITAQSDLLTSDGARRLGSTIGVDQQFKLTETISAMAGVSQRTLWDNSGSVEAIAPDAALSPVENHEDYVSGYAGLGYRTKTFSASARAEARATTSSNTYIGTMGVARELSETLSLAGAFRGQVQERKIEAPVKSYLEEKRADVRLGAAWRPRGEGTVVFDRFDYKYNLEADGTRTRKIVNNMAANTMVGDRTQVTGYWGLKQVETDIGDARYSNVTQLLGGEVRFDITERIDIGLHGQTISTGDSRNYAYGPSLGFAPVDNTWISVGYNFEGYEDEDFEAAEYSQDGAYLKIRLKFDQDTAGKLLKRISPTGR